LALATLRKSMKRKKPTQSRAGGNFSYH